MSKDLNNVSLLGRLGKNPEMRYTASGQVVTQISLATNSRYTNAAGQSVDDVQWHRVVFWGKAAEAINRHVSAGQRLYVEGRLSYRRWEDKESGQVRYSTDIVASDFIFIDPSPAISSPVASSSAAGVSEAPF